MFSHDGSVPSGLWTWATSMLAILPTWRRDRPTTERNALWERRAQEAAGAAPWNWDSASGKLQWKAPLDRWIDESDLTRVNDPNELLELLHPGDREEVSIAVRDASSRGDRFEFSCRLRNGDRALRVAGAPCYREDGRLSGVAGIAQETGDDPRVASALARQSQLLRQVHDAVISTDLDGRIETWNAGAERLYGYSAEQAEGKHIGILYFTEEEAYLEQQMTAAVLASGTHDFVGRFRHHSGVPLHADVRLAVLCDADGTPAGIVSCSHDVTRQREEQEAFQLQARVLESMAEGVCLTDSSGVILFTNPACDRMYGFERRGLLGKRLHEFLSSPRVGREDQWQCATDQLSRTGKWTGQLENRRGVGEDFATLARVSELILSDKPYWVWVQQDVTATEARRSNASTCASGA